MTSPGWLTRSQADVPAGEAWLGPHERTALAAMRFEKRRDDWRLGRLTAKAAVAARLDVKPGRVEIVAAPGGAPEARVDGVAAPVALSLSHRAGRALAVVGAPGTELGCDLELVEPRSAAFVADWLAPAERALVAERMPADRELLVNLFWTAKEAAAKARHEGLRLDLRQAEAGVQGLDSADTAWQALTVTWQGGERAHGWWRSEPGWVMTVITAPATTAPVALQ